jgi:hypothetical protein
MNKHIKWIALLTTALSLLAFADVGCTTNRPLFGGANKPPLMSAKHIPTFNYTEPTNSNYYWKVYTNAATISENEQESVRNQILNDLMGIIDYNYYVFEDNLRGDKTVQEMGADIATLGLTAAATVMGGAETKTILSAIATGVVGVNSSIDKHIFQNNTVQALQLQMRSMRAAVEVNLNTGMKQTIKDYPLQNGLRDIVAYYHAGSLTDALIGLVQSSGNNAQTNKDAANAARK